MEKNDYKSINKIKARRVKHPAYRLCQTYLDELLEESIENEGEDHEPGAHVFTAPSRIGKSATIVEFVARHQPDSLKTQLGVQQRITVAKVRVRTATTLKEYMSDICIELGIEPGNSSNRAKLTRKIFEGLKRAETKMLISDETNIVHESKGAKELVHIRNFLKELIDESGIPVVFFGLPSCISFFKGDKQTDARVQEYISLPPFIAPTNDKTPVALVTTKYLQFLKEDCGVTLKTEESLLQFSQRVYLASGGRIGGIQRIFVDVARYSYKTGKKTLTLPDFAASLKKRPIPFQLTCSDSPFLICQKELPGLMKKYPVPSETLL
jgi:hypothetical protein